MFVAAFIAKNTFKSYKRQVAVQGELTAHTKELLGGQKTVILFNEEKYSVQKFEEIDQRLYDVGWKAQYFSALVNPMPSSARWWAFWVRSSAFSPSAIRSF